MPRRLPTVAACLLTLMTIAGACSSGDPELAQPVRSDVGAGWDLELPEDWTITGTFGDPIQSDPGCAYDRISVSNKTARLQIALISSGCSADAIGRGNGRQPTFVSAEQLLDGDINIQTVDTPSGTLTIATVAYFECTNECIDYNPDVGLIELDQPADPMFPAIVISDDRATGSRSDIEFIAQRLSRIASN